MVNLSHPTVRIARNLRPRALKRTLAKCPSQLISPSPTERVLAFVPAFALFYVLLVLPLVGEAVQRRTVNILFWPLLGGGTLALAFYNRSRLDWNFFLSSPIVSLGAYLLFAAASIGWAFQPEYSFSRYFAQVLAVICVI